MSELKQIEWSEIPAEDLNESIRRRYVNQGGMTLARFALKKGGIVGLHQHVNSQVTNVLSGALLFYIDSKEITIRAGQVLFIPPNMPHEVHVVEDCDVLDIFIPERTDWINGTDTYFGRK